MSFAGKVWRLLVGIKDALALAFLLLFFFALYMVLSSRPNTAEVREGALLLDLDGYIVEERTEVDPIAALLQAEAPVAEYQARALVRAIDAATTDKRIGAVVLELDRFLVVLRLQDFGIGLHGGVDSLLEGDRPVVLSERAAGRSREESGHESECTLVHCGPH